MTQLLIVIVAILAFTSSLVSAEIVQIVGGKIKGKVVQSEANATVNEFLGIRFGKANRFEKPTFVEPWTDVLHATKFQSICYQFNIIPSQSSSAVQSEDCLFLNVWQPAKPKTNRSVAVFIHGGGYALGSSIMDGKDFAAQGDVILVTINYRLGALGFLAGKGITANLGLHDQILALKWVQQNIKYFGGDPNQVTIFGESAGSMSVGALTLSPLAKGLFKRAIMQSGAPIDIIFTKQFTKVEANMKALVHNVNCTHEKITDEIKCLQKVPVESLVKASIVSLDFNKLFVPVYGDEVMPIKPAVALKTGKFNHVDLMYGVTRDEGSGFVLILIPDVTNNVHLNLSRVKKDIIEYLKKYDVSHENEIAEFYTAKLGPNATQDDYKIAISNLFGDYVLICPTILFGEEMARQAPSNRYYSYRLMEYKPSMGPKWFGVAHAADIPYLFEVSSLKNDPERYQLSKDMIHAWSSFAKTGVPGKTGTVQWEEALDRKTKNFSTRYMSLETNKYKMVDGYYKDTCDTFWKPRFGFV